MASVFSGMQAIEKIKVAKNKSSQGRYITYLPFMQMVSIGQALEDVIWENNEVLDICTKVLNFLINSDWSN